MENTNVIDYNKNHYAVMANNIIRGKQTMSLQEAKLIRLLVTQIVKDDKDLKTYTVNIQELANFLEVDSSNLYREIRDICQSLMSRTIKIQKGKEWEIFHWLQVAKYDGKGTITLMLSNQIAPYLLGLNAWFTQYQLKNILAMKSFYSIRLYELLKLTVGQDRKKTMQYRFSVQELRETLECTEKFKKIIDFKKHVLNIAVRDITEFSEYRCTYDCKKTSRTITAIVFNLEDKSAKTKEEIEADLDDLADELREVIKEPLKTKDLKALLAAACNDIGLIKQYYDMARGKEIDNLVGWLLAAIKEDYASAKTRGKFNDFEQKTYDYDELERALITR